MRVGLAFANDVNMTFTPAGTDYINFYGTPSSADTVTMGTNGALTANTSVFEPTNTTGTPGSVDFTGDINSSVNISCTSSAVMAETVSNTTITVDQLELQMNTGTAFGVGSPYSCAGLGTTPLSYAVLPSNQILLGGRLVGNATIETAVYSSAVAGGTPATIRVVYQ